MENSLILFRFVLTFVLTFIFGFQRQKSNKPVGFGTFIFVAIGSCGLTIAALQMNVENPLPLLAAIITGIGFLGAGALIRTPDRIFGFTTAASIWVFAIFGLIIGLGYYIESLILYSLSWFIVLFDKHLEKRGVGSYRRKISIVHKGLLDKKEIAKILSKHCTKFNLVQISIDKNSKETQLIYLIEGATKSIELLLKEFYNKKWCKSVRFE